MNVDTNAKLQDSVTDINNLVGKGRDGSDVRMIDMSLAELRQCYRHAYQMLHNEDLYKPGKLKIRKNLQKYWNACNAELFVRYLLHECNTPIRTNKDLLDFIAEHRAQNQISIDDPITEIFSNIPRIFERLTITQVMDACFDKAEVLNRKILTDKFIYSQGIGLTEEEKKELTEFDGNGRIRNRMEVIKERLCLNPTVHLRITPSGLSYAEFRALVQLPPSLKISSLSSIALKTLRDKILLLLDNDLEYHIDKWINIQRNILRIAEYKNWDVN